MALDCGCSPQPAAVDVDNRGVFCSGPLLDRVQKSNMFPDCKHFVDMSCVYSPSQTMADFELFSNCARNDGSLTFLQMFVEKHFNEPGSELEPWTPPDWKAQPSFLSKVSDPEIKQFAFEVNEIWRQLGRRVSDAVKENPDYYSIIYIPKPFIIPAVNCREYRYWDSFWIVRGLLQSGMHQTARGMIENYLVLVQQYGYVPACGRIYCGERTHPPLLIMMVKAYVEVTKDEQFAIQSLPLLETEYETFVSKHSIEVKGRTMYQYRVSGATPGPRPEAYREDLAAAEHLQDEEPREKLFTELKSASESGQEFSSRWFVAQGGSNEASLKDTKPSAIVPVELNAIIFRSGKILAEFNRKAGNAKKGDEYQDRSCALVKAIRDVLWNEKAGIWLDYDVVNNQSRNYFCCTNFAPLWARAFPLIDTDKVSKSVMEYIKCNKLDELYGGVPHTKNKMAGEKWDYPNVFPPMMFLVVEGLDNLGTRASKAMSRRWAHRWVKSNYAAYKKEGFMFEMYNCETFGTSAGACPKPPAVVGYGWTNAVIIEFLCKYGREINLADDEDKACQSKSNKKTSYIITSEANMEGKDKECGPMSSKSLDKNKVCCCAASTTGAPPGKVNKSTAAMGAQSTVNCGPRQQQRDEGCSCAIAQTRSQQVQTQGERNSGEEGICLCGAGGGGGAQQQQQGYQTERASGRSQPQVQQASFCPVCKLGGTAQNQDQQTQHSPDCPFAGQHKSECPCAEEMRKLQQQLKKQQEPACPCGEEKRKQQQLQQQQQQQLQLQQQQQQEQLKQQQLQQQQQQWQQDPACPCGEEKRKQQQQQQQQQWQQQQKLQQQQQQQQKQQDSSCTCGADQDKRKQQPPKPVFSAPSKQPQPDTDPDCECQADAWEKMEQLRKQTACYQKQQELQQERQQQQQQWQREAQEQDCSPSNKPKQQDCSQQMKKPADSGCGCDADEEQERLERQEKLTGHYAPLSDSSDNIQASPSKKTSRQSGCSGCSNEDCPNAPSQDDSGNIGARSGPGKPQQQGTDENCSCLGGPPQAVASGICPHCGGIYTDPTPYTSVHTVGTNKPSLEDGCECSGGGGQQMKGMTSIAMQSGNSKVGNQPSRPIDGCYCSLDGGQMQVKMGGRAGTGGGAGQSACGPCQAHATAEYGPGHGPTPKFNKQFPLKDPAYDATGPCPPEEEKKKKKCCSCDEKEKEATP